VLVNEVVVLELEVAEQDKEVAEQVEEEVSIAPPGYVPCAGSPLTSTSSGAEESPRFGEQLATLFLLDLLSQYIVAGNQQNTDVTTIDEWGNRVREHILHCRYPDGVEDMT
jgi:hypothetical protein